MAAAAAAAEECDDVDCARACATKKRSSQLIGIKKIHAENNSAPGIYATYAITHITNVGNFIKLNRLRVCGFVRVMVSDCYYLLFFIYTEYVYGYIFIVQSSITPVQKCSRSLTVRIPKKICNSPTRVS